MKRISNIVIIIFLFALTSCLGTKKIIDETQLSIYDKAKNKMKSSAAFSEFLMNENIDCDKILVSDFMVNKCYYYNYLTEDLQNKMSDLNCESEKDNWGEVYKNLSSISNSAPQCVKVYFSETIDNKYIFIEVEKNPSTVFYSSLIFIMKLEDDNDFEIIETFEILHE